MAGDSYFDKVRDRATATAVGTTAGVTATIAAATGFKQAVTGIQCSSDAAALVTIESPSSTVLWRKRFAAAFTLSETFPIGFLAGAADQAVLVKVSASTAASEANIQAAKIKA